jgi:hypothetical protein
VLPGGTFEPRPRIIGYICHYPDATIRFHTGTPNHEAWGDILQHNWMYLVYGNLSDEDSPADMPPACGKSMLITTFVDANLYHDLTIGRSTTGVLHLVNQTPVSWFSK